MKNDVINKKNKTFFKCLTKWNSISIKNNCRKKIQKRKQNKTTHNNQKVKDIKLFILYDRNNNDNKRVILIHYFWMLCIHWKLKIINKMHK